MLGTIMRAYRIQTIPHTLLTLTDMLLAPLAAGAYAATPRPHIFFIVADDLRADITSAYGGLVQTPNLNKLAARGCLFSRATCGYPICQVSRTEMLTGHCKRCQARA